MSEQVNTSAPVSEPEQPTQSSKPKKGKKLWLMIVAVIVAILLISTAIYVLVIAPDEEEIGLELESELLPSDDLTFEADETQDLSVSSQLVNETEGITHEIDSWSNVTYDWECSPSDLGTFNLVAQRNVEFRAAKTSMTGTVTCTVTWGDESIELTADVTVKPPFLDSVFITPSTYGLAPEQSHEFTASALDSVADVITGLTYTWTVEGLDAENYTLVSIDADTVEFTGLVVGNVTLNATATHEGVTATGSASIAIGGEPMRSVDYRYYDLFNVPFGEWWEWRWELYKSEEVVSWEYPYIFKWYGNETNIWLYTNQRLQLTARNMPEINMNERPQFLPMFGQVTGGTAKIDWYMQYITEEEMSRYPDGTSDWLDGWVTILNGTVTLDKTAAMAVMNITSTGFDDFDTWWEHNGADFVNDYIDWIMGEGNDRLDIYNMFEYELTPLTFDIIGEKVGDEIVLHYDTVSWGMEAMMCRWLYDAFMPMEWYYEDMNFHATIGPQYTDIDMDTAVVYAAYAYETTLTTEACWMWEALMQDYIPSSLAHPYSLYDVYEDLDYYNWAPGSPWYGTMMQYDYAPGCHNLSENETMLFEWPSGELPFYKHAGDNQTLNLTGEMTCTYSEPDWVEFPGQVVVDTSARTLNFEGPIDFWSWSRYQWDIIESTRYDNLASEWDRVHVLPYGCPTIEFKLKSPDDPVMSGFLVSGIESPIEVGVLSDVTVTAIDQAGDVFPTYTGTIEFSSSDPLNTSLPGPYPFQSVDNGVKTFTDGVSFLSAGMYDVYVVDSDDPELTGMQLDIVVSPEEEPVPTDLLVTGVTSPIDEGVASGFTVTVLDQFGDVYVDGYTGTISFDSSDEDAELPVDYEFTVEDAGTNTWDAADGVIFHTPGTHTFTAYDTAMPSISGTQVSIVVVKVPVLTSLLVELSADSAIANYSLLDVTVTALDQDDEVFTAYVGTVEFSSSDSEAWFLMTDLTFEVGDLGVKTWTAEIMMGTPGLQTIWVNDSEDSGVTGFDTVTVTAEPEATYLLVTGISGTVMLDEPVDFTVTVYDQYNNLYPFYEGTVTFETVPADATLPPDYTFDWMTDWGTHDFSVTFTAEGLFTLRCTDTVDPTITGALEDIFVSSDEPYLVYFTVEDIEDPMWEDNYSDVTVTAYDQFGIVFSDFVGTIEFTTDASLGTYVLPADYTFLAGDLGTKTFASGVMFEDPGTYSVTVTNSSDTETGSQTGIDVVDLYADTLEISGAPAGVVGSGDPFSLTVSVYHQFGELCYDYVGTVEFSTTDTDLGVILPDPYTFTSTDAGVHVFTDAFELVTGGDQDIIAEDQSDPTLSDTVTVSIQTLPQREVDYKIYDFLDEPMGAWWDERWTGYSTDIIVSTGANANAYLYFVDGDEETTHAIIYAPYRYNITASNLTGLNVHDPVFFDTMNAPVAGAQVDLSVYFQYIFDPWYTDVRADWSSGAFYGVLPPTTYAKTQQEGYIVGTMYSIKMNRAAAYEWINLPTTEANPVTWYAGVGATHATAVGGWFDTQGNIDFDICYGYEDNYYSSYTATRLSYDSGTQEVTLEVLHFNWGYEVLMTRWLTHADVSANHEPWYEDFHLNVSYGEVYTDLCLDAVCQYSLQAVQADGTTGEAAWAWEPCHIDYCVEEELPPIANPEPDHPSEFVPYYPLTYVGYNAGDIQFGEDVVYPYTPYWYNLSEGETLTFEWPTTTVLGYDAVPLVWQDYVDAAGGDLSAFEAIEASGTMSLGYYYSGGPDLGSMVSGNTMVIEGPVSFDNIRHTPDGPLMHGAPWIEFDVGGVKAASASGAAEVAEPVQTASAGASATSEMLSLVAVVCATMLAVAAIGAGRKVYA